MSIAIPPRHIFVQGPDGTLIQQENPAWAAYFFPNGPGSQGSGGGLGSTQGGQVVTPTLDIPSYQAVFRPEDFATVEEYEAAIAGLVPDFFNDPITGQVDPTRAGFMDARGRPARMFNTGYTKYNGVAFENWIRNNPDAALNLYFAVRPSGEAWLTPQEQQLVMLNVGPERIAQYREETRQEAGLYEPGGTIEVPGVGSFMNIGGDSWTGPDGQLYTRDERGFFVLAPGTQDINQAAHERAAEGPTQTVTGPDGREYIDNGDGTWMGLDDGRFYVQNEDGTFTPTDAPGIDDGPPPPPPVDHSDAVPVPLEENPDRSGARPVPVEQQVDRSGAVPVPVQELPPPAPPVAPAPPPPAPAPTQQAPPPPPPAPAPTYPSQPLPGDMGFTEFGPGELPTPPPPPTIAGGGGGFTAQSAQVNFGGGPSLGLGEPPLPGMVWDGQMGQWVFPRPSMPVPAPPNFPNR